MAEEQQPDEDYIEIKIPNQESAPEKDVAKKQESQKEQLAPKATLKKKKTAKKHAEKKPITPKRAKQVRQHDRNSGNWLWAVLLIIGLIVIAAVIYLSLQSRGETPKTEGQQVAALVNNQPIYQEEVDKIHDSLPSSMGTIDKEVILDQLIEQELFVQEARKQGLQVSEDELQSYIDELLEYFGVPKSQFDAALEAQGMTRKEFERNSERQIIVNKLINKTVYEEVSITADEIAARYEEDKEFFAVPASVTVKHILITAKTNETEEETQERAQEVLGLIEEDFANFCDLVTNNTADVASIPTCGEYEITQNGQYVPAFEEAAFAMDVGDIDIIKTEFGHHIIWKVAEYPARTLMLEEVSDQLEAILFQEEANERIITYLGVIRDEAVIEKYPVIADNQLTAPTNGKDDQDKAEVIVEETRPVREGSFGACLEKQGAVLYGVSWAPDVDEQKAILGEAFKEMTYVDCDPAGGTAPATCDDIDVYPTWIIGSGEDALLLKGKQSLNSLSRETGCAS